MSPDDHPLDKAAEPPGLRDRKKAIRREEILNHARALFAQKGIRATTVAEIARAAGISAPTVFNYFGNKDGILIALITEGSDRSRQTRATRELREDTDFATIVVEMLTEVSRATLAIANKRVWRYAEAAAIRHPTTELARRYAENDRALQATIREFLGRYDLRLRAGTPPDPDYLARLVFDVWTSDFFDLIRVEERSLEAHHDRLRHSLAPLIALLFTDDFIAAPKLRPEHRRHARR